MNTSINFEVAKLLKEKGFDLNYYLDIADVVMLLYDKYEIWISPQPFIRQNQTIVWLYDIFKNNYIIEQLAPSKGVSSPTEAYLNGIEYTLNNLI